MEEAGTDYQDSSSPQPLDVAEHDEEHDCALDCIEKMKEAMKTKSANFDNFCNCKNEKKGEQTLLIN